MNPIEVLLGLGTTLINRLFPDPAQAAQAKLQLLEMQQKGELASMTAQTGINQQEALSNSVFVAGWRPFIGWCCGAVFGMQFLVFPLVSWISAMTGHPFSFPTFDMATLLTLLGGMLGLNGIHSVENVMKSK